MALSVETVNRLLASGRNYASMAVGLIGGVGLMTAAQQKGVMDALTEIGNGLSMIFHGATSIWQILAIAFPALAIWFAKIASKSAKVDNQSAQVQAAVKDPNTTVSKEATASLLDAATNLDVVQKDQTVIKVTDPTVAAAVPSSVVQTAH